MFTPTTCQTDKDASWQQTAKEAACNVMLPLCYFIHFKRNQWPRQQEHGAIQTTAMKAHSLTYYKRRLIILAPFLDQPNGMQGIWLGKNPQPGWLKSLVFMGRGGRVCTQLGHFLQNIYFFNCLTLKICWALRHLHHQSPFWKKLTFLWMSLQGLNKPHVCLLFTLSLFTATPKARNLTEVIWKEVLSSCFKSRPGGHFIWFDF